MAVIKDTQFVGKRVILEDGADIGLVTDIFVDPSDWRITRFNVKLEKRYAERLDVESGILKKPVIPVKIHLLATVGDVVRIKSDVDGLARTLRRVIPEVEEAEAREKEKAKQKGREKGKEKASAPPPKQPPRPVPSTTEKAPTKPAPPPSKDQKKPRSI